MTDRRSATTTVHGTHLSYTYFLVCINIHHRRRRSHSCQGHEVDTVWFTLRFCKLYGNGKRNDHKKDGTCTERRETKPVKESKKKNSRLWHTRMQRQACVGMRCLTEFKEPSAEQRTRGHARVLALYVATVRVP